MWSQTAQQPHVVISGVLESKAMKREENWFFLGTPLWNPIPFLRREKEGIAT